MLSCGKVSKNCHNYLKRILENHSFFQLHIYMILDFLNTLQSKQHVARDWMQTQKGEDRYNSQTSVKHVNKYVQYHSPNSFCFRKYIYFSQKYFVLKYNELTTVNFGRSNKYVNFFSVLISNMVTINRLTQVNQSSSGSLHNCSV